MKQIEFFHWGLIPSWAKDPKIGSRMINARSETLAEKPSFRSAYKRRRCLVLADGYYEWQKIAGEKSKQPVYIRLKSQKPFAFAGLWEVWKGTGMNEPLRSCTVITCPPNTVLAEIHHRMPVILPAETYAAWLAQMSNRQKSFSRFSFPTRMKRWRRIRCRGLSIVLRIIRRSVSFQLMLSVERNQKARWLRSRWFKP